MKKILKLLALLLTLVMILPMVPVMTFADDSAQASSTNTYRVTEYKSAAADGAIGTDEYSVTANLSPVAYSYDTTFGQFDAVTGREGYVSEEMSISFSHDEEKIYIGLYDKNGTAADAIRNGYAIRLGFDEAHPENYVGFYLQCVNFTGTNGSKTTVADELRYKTSTDLYPQAGYRGIVRSNGNFVWWASTADTDKDGCTRMFYSEDTADAYPITAMEVLREDVDGDISLGDYGRITSGQHYTYYEIELDKEKLLAFYNGMTFKNGSAAVEDLSTMLFGVQQKCCNPEKINVLWNGTMGEVASGAHIFSAWNLDKVLFLESEIVENDKVSTQHTSLTAIGQDIYSTGSNNYKVEDGEISIDGSVDQGKYVCVTPNYVTKTLANSWASAKSDSSYNDSNKLLPDPGAAVNNPSYAPDLKYYVAQSDNCIYLTVELTEATTPADYYIAYFRIGFNPADYRQQIIGYSESSAITFESASDNTAKSSITRLVLAKGKRSSASTFEMQFNKEQIKAVYLEQFGVALTDADLNSMFVGISLRSRVGSGDNAADKARPFYGTLLTTAAAEAAGQGSNTYIPDVIVFGEEKDANVTAFANCTFNVHCLADRYKVAGTTDTYYHSCAHCGMAGASTFKADANGIVFDKEVVSEDTVLSTAYTCAAAGTYFKSCSCGRVDTDTTNTFTYGGAHVYVEKMAEQHLAKAATCKAGAIYKKSCKECGVAHETETFTTAPLRWPVGTTTPITLDKDHTYFAALGQDVYTTGSSDYTSTSTIEINGAIDADEGWVCVTPNGVDLTVSTGHLGTKVSSVAINAVDDATVATYGEGQQTLIDSMDVKYYVAQDDEYVYVAVQQSNVTMSYAVENTTYYSSNQVLAYLKLGFNPVDYTQQITLYSNGQFINAAKAMGKIDDVTYSNTGGYIRYPMVVKGLGDNNSFTSITGFTGIIDDLYADSKFNRTTEGTTVRAYEMRLKKSAIKAQYDAVFGAGTSDSIDFSTMFIGGSYSDNVWTTRDTRTFYMVAGTLQAADTTKNSFIPDVVVFGAEKGMGCNFQGHIVNDDYAVDAENEPGVYYHSCTECGAVGLTTFKVVDGKVQFTVFEEKDEYLVEGSEPDCASGSRYYKQCVCGAASEETFESSDRDFSKHNYSDEFFCDNAYHWNECIKCGATISVERHDYDGASDADCNVCEYVRTVETSAPVTEAPATEAPETEEPTVEDTATEAPETEEPAVEDTATEAPETEEPAVEDSATEAPATEEPATEEPATEEPAGDEGCNGAISIAGMAVVAMLGTCAVFATKKKED